MLIRHSAIYLLGRLMPSIVSLCALALYTRILTPDQYGHYALVIAGAGIINGVCFQWLSLSISRFLPIYKNQPTALLSAALTGFLMLVVITGVLGGVVAWLWPDSLLRWPIILTVIVSWAQAWFDLNLRIVNIRFAPILYGFLASFKALIAVSLGVILFYLNLGVYGIILGLIISLFIATVFVWKHWYGFTVRHYDVHLLQDLIGYGVPLALTFMLTLVVDASDRFFLGWIMGAKAVGDYAAAYDLTQQSLGMLMGTIYLAAFPLAIRALEEEGVEGSRKQLSKIAFLLLAVSLPATIGMIILADNIAVVMLGVEFLESAARIIPWIALATFIGGFKLFYLDLSFQLRLNLYMQAWIMGFAATIKIVLNLLLIPVYGYMGAAYATVGAFVVGFASSWWLGWKVFPLPFPKNVDKLIIATLGMAISLWPTLAWRGITLLFLQIVMGILVYSLMLVALIPKPEFNSMLLEIKNLSFNYDRKE